MIVLCVLTLETCVTDMGVSVSFLDTRFVGREEEVVVDE